MNLSFLDRVQPLGFFILRVVLGVIMVVHGYHKVFGGLHHHAQFVAGLGIPAWLGYVSSFAEFLGGILLIVGFSPGLPQSPFASICAWPSRKCIGTTDSPGQGGFEFPLSLAAIAFALIFTGAGPISVDWLTGRK